MFVIKYTQRTNRPKSHFTPLPTFNLSRFNYPEVKTPVWMDRTFEALNACQAHKTCKSFLECFEMTAACRLPFLPLFNDASYFSYEIAVLGCCYLFSVKMCIISELMACM